MIISYFWINLRIILLVINVILHKSKIKVEAISYILVDTYLNTYMHTYSYTHAHQYLL